MGPTRSTRLPAALDEWLESRLMLHRDKSVSEILLELIHGGLRLREGYMAIHRRVLEQRIHDDRAGYDAYRRVCSTRSGRSTSSISTAGSKPTAS
jgi:hypothetical protein